jgi:transcriptional regulator with XRE-family HTH domain
MRPEWDDGPATNGCSVIPYGRLIAAARVLAGWSQAELSLASGVSERTLQRLERGDTGASIGTVSAILKALERRGVVLSGGDRQIRSGVQVLRGTDADRQLEEEIARGARWRRTVAHRRTRGEQAKRDARMRPMTVMGPRRCRKPPRIERGPSPSARWQASSCVLHRGSVPTVPAGCRNC